MKKIQFVVLVITRFLARYKKELSSSNFGQFKQVISLRLFRGKRILLISLFTLMAILTVWQLWPRYFLADAIAEGLVGIYHQNSLPPVVTRLLSDSLVSLDPSGKPQPNLASGWQVNNNATIYDFKLKENLYWNDGSKIKASDIKFSLPDVEVSYPDDQTIKFKLADSFSPFPTLLINPVFKDNSLIGVGKYKISTQELSRSLVTKLILSPVKQFEHLPPVIIRFYPDEKTAKVAFELGEVDALLGMSLVDDLKNQSTVKVIQLPNRNKLVAIFYNIKDPVLSEKNFRKALGAASTKVDNEERAKTSIFTGSWAFNDELKDLLGDQALAKNYLAKVQSGKDSTITLTTTPALSDIGEKIIQGWKEIGLNAVLRVESGVPQNFQALLVTESIPLDPDQYALWHSTQEKTNISRYSSPRVDKDLEDGRKTGDLEVRKEKYLDFQKVLQDDSPATFLYFPKTQVIFRKKAEASLNKVINFQLP